VASPRRTGPWWYSSTAGDLELAAVRWGNAQCQNRSSLRSCATQRPLAAAAFSENATAAGWKTIPSWYQISRQDNAIPPQAEEFMAARMNSVTEQVDGSHTAFIAQPGKEIPALPVIPTTYPGQGGGTSTDLTINPADYPRVFLDNELPAYEEDALAAEQRPLSLNALTQASTTPAWLTIPSWYMVANQDRAIAPNLERFMAARMHAHTVDVNGPHLLMLTDPTAVTTLIEQAATATTGS
jgi:pimeloyl-ACP methyl ester carboxylesterase